MKQVDEVITIIDEPFETLEECFNYYQDILSSVKECKDLEIYNKKEYKSKHKYVMTQFNENLKVIKKKGEHSRKEEINSLRKPYKNLPTETLQKLPESPPTKQIEPKPEQYSIEDSKPKEEKTDENT